MSLSFIIVALATKQNLVINGITNDDFIDKCGNTTLPLYCNVKVSSYTDELGSTQQPAYWNEITNNSNTYSTEGCGRSTPQLNRCKLCLCTLSRRNVNSADAKEVVGIILECCASCQARILQQKFDELSAKDPNESARATYKYCASKYNDILYQMLAQAYVHLRLGRYADSTGDLNKALLFQNHCFNLLKNMKYPYYLRTYLKNFYGYLQDAEDILSQLHKIVI